MAMVTVWPTEFTNASTLPYTYTSVPVSPGLILAVRLSTLCNGLLSGPSQMFSPGISDVS